MNFRIFVGYTALYPFGATKLFFGVHHNNKVRVSLQISVPKGYQVLTATSGSSNGTLKATCRVSDMAAVIMPGFAELVHNNLRIVADTLYNKTFDGSYLEFAAVATHVHNDMAIVYPTTFADKLMTVAIVPFLNMRPTNYGHRMCMFDAAVVAREPHLHRYYVTLCMVHQKMTDLWTGGETVFYYMFEGLREYFALKALDQHQAMLGRSRMMKYFGQILRGDDHSSTATVMARRDHEYVSKPSIIYKSE